MNGFLECSTKTSAISLTLRTTTPNSDMPTNCFGFLSSSSCSALTNHISCKTFGYFYCNSAKSPTFPIQCFTNQRPPFQTVLVNEKLASLYGLIDGDEVLLEPVENLRKCQSAEFVPLSYEDWNIIDQSAYEIEDILLNQIRVIQQGVRIVLFLSPSISISLQVENTCPASDKHTVMVLSTDTLVLVAPLDNPSDNIDKPPSTVYQKTSDWMMMLEFDSLDMKPFLNCSTKPELFRKLPASFCFPLNTFQLLNVVVVLDNRPNIDRTAYYKTYIVKLENCETLVSTCATLVQISCFTANIIYQRMHGQGHIFNKLAKKLWKANEINKANHCWVSQAVSQMFGDCTWLSVNYYFGQDEFQRVERLETPFYTKKMTKKVLEAIKKSFDECVFTKLHIPFVMPMSGQEFTMCVEDDEIVSIKLVPHTNSSSAPYAYWWSENCVPIVFSPKEEQTAGVQNNNGETANALVNHAEHANKANEELSVQTDLLAQLERVIHAKLTSGMPVKDHLLLVGGCGSGKSSLLALLARRLFNHHNCSIVFSYLVDCRQWQGQPVESICNSLCQILDGLNKKRPSVLFLDNFDFLNWLQEDEDQLLSVHNIYSKITDELHKKGVLCICSVESAKNMPDWLGFPCGRRLFCHQFEIAGLQKHQQLKVLSSLLSIPLSFGAIEKDINFTIGELINIAETVVFKTVSKGVVSMKDVQEAIENVPRAGQPVQKCRDERSICFEDICGMHTVKQQLVEIFFWPTKYAQLYAKCGIAIGRGVILHGPSGCGKSMLMRALVSECKFNVITIKGPELLSKYIGKSEENVRKVFERARVSRPCILAFDEFDSLAPVRGHDSTGVTDRVVNQLLTEMDGVESGMEGVYVLAATNRISLIDPALLRPGRFDHKVLVDLPNQEDRLAILQLYSNELFTPANSDVDLFQIAQNTAGWSGSELKGLLVNAHFRMIAEQTNQLQDRHLEKVFKSSTPEKNFNQKTVGPKKAVWINRKKVTQA